ncbi:MAG: hypothetical protein Q7Q73_17270 [Verrucomicrobiota bacterium JB024]|nr:hypothetical protein [Verrucomicrobiota bacterium JB024]
MKNHESPTLQLVDAKGLLNALFDENSRPSLRWLRQMTAQRKIPYYKVGHLVRFNVEDVREAIAASCQINARR